VRTRTGRRAGARAPEKRFLINYNDLDVREFFGPVFTAVNGETVIGLNTTNGVLRMSLIFDKSIEKAAKFRVLGDRIEALFAEIVQQIS
jgi:hypothetical protein